jgi:hypothetical protein
VTLVEEITRAHVEVARGEPGAKAKLERQADQAVTAFVGEHLDELLAELREDAENAAQDVNRAAARLVDAYDERMRVEQRTVSILSTVRRPTRPGAIRATRAEALARQANRLLSEGGEAAPLPRIDPREPLHGEQLAALDPDAEIEETVA